jgi:alanyl-tRNA synthetase
LLKIAKAVKAEEAEEAEAVEAAEAEAAEAAEEEAAQAAQAAQAAVDSEDEAAAVEVMETAALLAPINPPDPTELLAYARALVQACRLDEVACLGRLVERRCAWRPECKPMLRAFVRGVDEAVKGQFGGRLASLAGMRRILLDQRVDVDA